MKARYKLGTMVEYAFNGTTDFGVVEGILTHKEGFKYIVTGQEPNEAIAESDILNAFRPITPRTKKTSSPSKSMKKKKTAGTETSLSQ